MDRDDLNGRARESDEDLSQELTKQIAKGGGITLVGRIGGKVIKFALQVLLTRVLGASTYGLYALGVNVVGISKTLSLLGLQNGVVKFGSMYRGDGDESRLKGTIVASLVISFLAGIVVGLLLYIFSGPIANFVFNEPRLASILKVFSLSLPFYTLMIVTAYAARIFRRMEYDVGLRLITQPLILMIFSGISFFLGYGISGVLYGFLFSSIFSSVVGVYLLKGMFPHLLSGLKPEFELKKLLFFALTVFLMGISSILIFRIDRLMLGMLGSAKNVGIYNAAAVMAGQVPIFLGSFNAIFSPIIADLHNKGKMVELHDLFKTTTKWIFTLTFPVFLVFVMFSKQIMGIYGGEFRVGWSVLVGMGLAQLLNAAVGASSFILTMTGHQKLELANNLILGSANIVLNLLLIPRFGILGAAIATGISIALVNIARVAEVYAIHRIDPYKWSYWKPAVAGGLSSALVVVMANVFPQGGWFFLVWIFLFLLFYFAVLIIIGFDERDQFIIRTVFSKLRTFIVG